MDDVTNETSTKMSQSDATVRVPAELFYRVVGALASATYPNNSDKDRDNAHNLWKDLLALRSGPVKPIGYDGDQHASDHIQDQESGNPDDFTHDMKQLLRKQVTEALRQAKRYDEEGGFIYRAKQSVTLFDGGSPIKHYFDTDKGGTATLRQKSTRQRRQAIAHDVYRAVCDVERMNKVFSDEPELKFLQDFTDDVAELRAAERLDRDPPNDANNRSSCCPDQIDAAFASTSKRPSE